MLVYYCLSIAMRGDTVKILLLAALMAAPTAALAEPKASTSVCESLAVAVDADMKQLAASGVSDFFEDSAMRETNRRLGRVVAASLIQSNLMLMQANKCLPPKAPISDGTYINDALQCEIAKSKAQRLGDKSLPAECDRDKWVQKTK